jgi:hypothetical protein
MNMRAREMQWAAAGFVGGFLLCYLLVGASRSQPPAPGLLTTWLRQYDASMSMRDYWVGLLSVFLATGSLRGTDMGLANQRIVEGGPG